MFVNTIDPVIATLGPLQIRWYGVIYAFGFIITLAWLEWLRRKGSLNISKDDNYDLVFYLMIGVVVGARMFEVFVWNPGYYFTNPSQIIAVWRGGLSFHGGLVGAVVAAYYFSKKKNLAFWRLADILTIPATFGLALGRIGNFINAELYGPITNVSWCVQFPDVDGCRHPYQIYSFIKRFAVGCFLLLLFNKKHTDGFIFWSFMLLIGTGRFFIDFVRVDELLYGLSTGQWLSAGMVFISAYVVGKHYKQDVVAFLK